MSPEFAGIERRLDRLNECLQKLEPLRQRPLAEFLTDAYLRDIVERNITNWQQKTAPRSNIGVFAF